MSVGRNEVAAFQYSSTAGTAGEAIVALLGTANNSTTRIIKVTDLKATCGGTARTLQVLGRTTHGTTYGQALSFDLPANSHIDFTWEIPYRIIAQSSTGVARGIVASASGAGVKYSISGYIEK